MKIFSKLSLTTVSLILFLNFLAVPEAKAQLREILKRIETHQKTLYSLRSKVRMEQFNAQLQESDVTEGKTIYLRSVEKKVSVRIDWTKPSEESLAFINGQYILYRPRLKQAVVGKIDKTKQDSRIYKALSFLGESKKELKSDFVVVYLGIEKIKDGTETLRLKFMPKKFAIYQSAELWVNKDGMPIQAKVLESNNDWTTVLLSDFKENETMSVKEFPIRLPKATKVINSDGLICTCFKPENADDALKNWSDVVFSGVVTAVNKENYTFKPERLWKGTVGNQVAVRDFSATDCGIKLAIGKRYIVFAQEVSDKGQPILGLMPCNTTSNLDDESGKKILKEIGNGNFLKKKSIRKLRSSKQKYRKRSH